MRDELKTTRIVVAGIELTLLDNGYDKSWYQKRDAIEEVNSRWYSVLANEGIKTFIDVGANYGMIGAICAKNIDGLNVVAIEPDPRLVSLIDMNLSRNNVLDYTVIHAAVADISAESLSFSLNPKSTLDNRVDMTGWDKVEVPALTLDSLFEKGMISAPFYVKVDTQGFEKQVFLGAEKLLESSYEWIVKAEFAPHWLVSQGTDPVEFLTDIIKKYDVYESPQRYLFSAKFEMTGLGVPILKDDVNAFVAHVRSLNSAGMGWVDLIVRPRSRWRRVRTFINKLLAYKIHINLNRLMIF